MEKSKKMKKKKKKKNGFKKRVALCRANVELSSRNGKTFIREL